MSNLRIIYPNDSDEATLTASPSLVATLPVENLQDVARARVARSTSTAAQDFKGTWSTSRLLSAAALVRHNLTSAGTWRLRLYSDAAWTTLVYDSGAVVACPPKALGDLEWGIDPLGASLFTNWALAFSSMWFAPVAAKSFTLTLTDAANPAGYLEASRLFVGRYLQPTYNMAWGFKLSWVEASSQERTEGGTLRSDGQEPYRRMSFKLADLTASDRPKFQEWSRRNGLRTDAFVSAFPENANAQERDYAMSAKLIASPDMEGDYLNNFTAEYVLEEA